VENNLVGSGEKMATSSFPMTCHHIKNGLSLPMNVTRIFPDVVEQLKEKFESE
jgi:hypothetical protein